MAKIKLNEAKLRKIISESIKGVLMERGFDWDGNREAYYADIERDNPMSPHYQPLEGTCRVNIGEPLHNFVARNFNDDIADDFENYLYDLHINEPYAKVIDDHVEEIFDEDKIIEHIKSYDNKKVAQAVINSFDEIIFNYKFNENWDYTWDED